MASRVQRGQALWPSIQARDDLLLRLQSGDKINLERGNFQGDLQAAMSYLRDFCQKNPVTNISDRWGRGGVVMLNSTPHNYFVGIEIADMLKWCGNKTAADFPVT